MKAAELRHIEFNDHALVAWTFDERGRTNSAVAVPYASIEYAELVMDPTVKSDGTPKPDESLTVTLRFHLRSGFSTGITVKYLDGAGWAHLAQILDHVGVDRTLVTA